MKQTDIVIIGAGPAGLSFACSLADTNLKVLLIEKAAKKSLANPDPDGREIALTHASYKIMNNIGAWQRLPDADVAPINHAKVFSGQSPYSLDFDNNQDSADPLGYLVPNYCIRKALYEEAITLPHIELLADVAVEDIACNDEGCTIELSNGEQVQASLAVAADSRFSTIRKKMGIPAEMRDFSRVAIVCRMQHENPHNQTAVEFFQYGQTMAALPMNGNMSSLVITISADKSGAILDMNEEQFNQLVEQHFGHIFGSMELVGERFHYPLIGVHAKRFIGKRFALIGDAAVGMHPVTAHGFNLGLRGQETLHQGIRQALNRGVNYASPQVLEKYQRKHMLATRPIYHGTNAVVGLFTNDSQPARMIRDLTLRVANNLPPLKYLITQKLTEKRTGLPFI